jgi:protein OS-9
MTMTDTILFVKEAKTCSYVLVVHTPRLCGEPGFKSRHETSEESLIRCREIVHSMPDLQANIPDADHPLKIPPRKTVLPSPPSKEKAGDAERKDKLYSELLRKTLEAIMASKDGKLQPGVVAIEEMSDDKQVIVEILDEESMTEGQAEALEQLTGALRAAGYDIKAEKHGAEHEGNRKEDKKERQKTVPTVRDEL